VSDAELFQPVFYFGLDPFELPGIGLAGIDMGVDHVDIRSEAPEMDIMKTVNTVNRFDLPDPYLHIDVAGRELEQDPLHPAEV
jgi:hypothetical protein